MSRRGECKVSPQAWRRVSNICGEVRGVFETEDVELRSERLEPLYGVKNIELILHEAIVIVLNEAGINNITLRRACIDAAIKKLYRLTSSTI